MVRINQMQTKHSSKSKRNNNKSNNEPKSHPGSSELARRALRWFGRIYGSLFYKTEVYGMENVPQTGTVLLLAKHQRNDDIPLGLAKALYYRRMDIWAMMKESLAAPIFLNFFLKCGGIPLNRTEPRKSKNDLLFAKKVLFEGNMLVIFPEQTTVPYKMGRGRPGGFRFIVGKLESPLPVLCLGLDYKPNGFLRRTSLIVRAGELKHLQPGQDPEEFMHDCMLEIASLTNMKYPFEYKKRTSESDSEFESLETTA